MIDELAKALGPYVPIVMLIAWAVRSEMRSSRHEKILSEEAMLKFRADFTTCQNQIAQHEKELHMLWEKWDGHKVDR